MLKFGQLFVLILLGAMSLPAGSEAQIGEEANRETDLRLENAGFTRSMAGLMSLAL